MSSRIIVICLLLTLGAPPAIAAEHSDAAGIAWFDGDVNAAFAEAQKRTHSCKQTSTPELRCFFGKELR